MIAVFEKYAARLSAFVKAKAPDMRECHGATAYLKRVLRSDGYHDARVMGCSVIADNIEGHKGGCGTFTIGAPAAHSVVLVSGYLIDPTAGQFRDSHLRIPDYLVFPPELVTPMLRDNRGWVQGDGNRLHTLAVDGLRIAYVPTDESFLLRG